jgi:hypothetical protein
MPRRKVSPACHLAWALSQLRQRAKRPDAHTQGGSCFIQSTVGERRKGGSGPSCRRPECMPLAFANRTNACTPTDETEHPLSEMLHRPPRCIRDRMLRARGYSFVSSPHLSLKDPLDEKKRVSFEILVLCPFNVHCSNAFGVKFACCVCVVPLMIWDPGYYALFLERFWGVSRKTSCLVLIQNIIFVLVFHSRSVCNLNKSYIGKDAEANSSSTEVTFQAYAPIKIKSTLQIDCLKNRTSVYENQSKFG